MKWGRHTEGGRGKELQAQCVANIEACEPGPGRKQSWGSAKRAAGRGDETSGEEADHGSI